MKICFLTSQKRLSHYNFSVLLSYLYLLIDRQIENNFNTFLFCGDSDFDYVTSEIIIAKRNSGVPIKLVLILPCFNYGEILNENKSFKFLELLNNADEIIYTSEVYYDGCVEDRNNFLIDIVDVFCIV